MKSSRKPVARPLLSVLLLTSILGCGSQPEAARDGAPSEAADDRSAQSGDARPVLSAD